MRHALIAFAAWTMAACGGARAVGRTSADAEYLRSRDLMVPVAGVPRRRLNDTFTAPRSGGRAHLALDILAKRGTRVLAADDGFILRVGENELGGRTVYLSDPERRFIYYYAHLDRWAAGLREGDRVKRGQLVGTVGTTGNAPKDVPHLHFQLMRMGTTRQWWNGEPINPIPFLRRTGKAS